MIDPRVEGGRPDEPAGLAPTTGRIPAWRLLDQSSSQRDRFCPDLLEIDGGVALSGGSRAGRRFGSIAARSRLDRRRRRRQRRASGSGSVAQGTGRRCTRTQIHREHPAPRVSADRGRRSAKSSSRRGVEERVETRSPGCHRLPCCRSRTYRRTSSNCTSSMG